MKEVFAKESGSSSKLIDGWFVDVRKRIGWSKIKRDRFQNKRKPLVDAATRFFVTGRPIPTNLGADFAEMAGIAKELYSHKFCRSDLAIKLASKPPDQPPSPSPPQLSYSSSTQPPGYTSFPSLEFTKRDDVTNPLTTLHSAKTCDVFSSNRKRFRSEDTPEPESRSNKRVRQVTFLVVAVLSLNQFHRRESSPKLLPQHVILSPTSSLTAFLSSPPLTDTHQPSPSLTTDTYQLSPSLTMDSYQPSPSRALQKRRCMSDSSDPCWNRTFSTAGRIAGLQSMSVPILPLDHRKHSRRSNSPSSIMDKPVLQEDGATQSLLSNPSTDEAATCAAPNHLRSAQLDYTIPDMTYPLSTEVSGRVQSIEVDAMDLSLLSNDIFQNYQLPPSSSGVSSKYSSYLPWADFILTHHFSALFSIPANFEHAAAQSIDNMDLASLSGYFGGTLNDNQLLDSLSIPSDSDPMIAPPVQLDPFPDFPDVDINLSSFFSTLPTSSGRLPEPLVSDLVNTAPEYCTRHSGQAKKLAQLEQLKRYGTHLQECIKSL